MAALLAGKMKTYIPKSNQDREYVRKLSAKDSVYAELGATIVLRCTQAAMMHFTGLVGEGSQLSASTGVVTPSSAMRNMCESGGDNISALDFGLRLRDPLQTLTITNA